MSSPARSKLLIQTVALSVLTVTYYTVPTGKTAVFRDWFLRNAGGAPGTVQYYTLIDGVQLPIWTQTLAANSADYRAMRLCLEAGHALRASCTVGAAVNLAVSGALLTA